MINPGRLEITTKIGCKINCNYCPQKLLMNTYFKDNSERCSIMSLDIFKRCIDKLPKGTRIDFSGMVEPWLNPECTDMVLYAVEKNFPVAIYSTLVEMKKEDIDRLKNIKFEEFVLHIPDDKSNANINVTKEYIDLIEYVIKDLDKERDFLTGYSCHGGIHPQIIDKIPKDSKLITELCSRAGNLSDESLSTKENSGSICCINCGIELNHNVLLPDGTVLLCCMDYGMEHVLGNLLTQEYEEIMHSDEILDIRRNLEIEEKKILCRECTNARIFLELWEEYDKIRSWNHSFEKNEKEYVKDNQRYKKWVMNEQKQIEDLKAEVAQNEKRYNDRSEELEVYKEWVSNLQVQNKEIAVYKEWITDLQLQIKELECEK